MFGHLPLATSPDEGVRARFPTIRGQSMVLGRVPGPALGDRRLYYSGDKSKRRRTCEQTCAAKQAGPGQLGRCIAPQLVGWFLRCRPRLAMVGPRGKITTAGGGQPKGSTTLSNGHFILESGTFVKVKPFLRVIMSEPPGPTIRASISHGAHQRLVAAVVLEVMYGFASYWSHVDARAGEPPMLSRPD
jgi:hypothetical protein